MPMRMQDDIGAASTVPPSEPLSVDVLVDIFASALDMDVDADDDFFGLGGASLQAAHVFSQIEKRLGLKLPMALLVRHSTPRSLAEAIGQTVGPDDDSSLIPIQRAGHRPPLLLVHPLDGSIVRYQALSELLPDQPVYGLQYPDQAAHPIPAYSVVELAERFIADIRKEFPSGPYCIGGYSFGGLVAVEIAARLREAGEDVPRLVIFDSVIHGMEATIDAKLRSFLSGFAEVPTAEWPAYVWHKIKRRLTGQRSGLYMPADIRNRHVPSTVRELKEILRTAARTYQIRSYDGPVFFVSAISRPWVSTQQVIRPWQQYLSGSIEHFIVRTKHLQLLDEPHLSRIAEKLAHNLDQ